MATFTSAEVYCVTGVPVKTTTGKTVAALAFSSTENYPGCTEFVVLTSSAFNSLASMSTVTSGNVSVTCPDPSISWPDIFNISASDGALLSLAILGVWVSAYCIKLLYRALNVGGGSSE